MATSNTSFNLQRFILSVVLVGITLILGIYITSTIGTTVQAQNTANTILNETGAWINSTGYTVDSASALDFANFAVTQARNATSGLVIAAANYTVNAATGTITNATAVIWPSVDLTYTYTFTNETASSTASFAVVSALATGTSWISILVVVGFATIILSMLTRGLSNTAIREMEVPYY